MGLDYSNGCVNFRDVGEFVNLLVGRQVLKEKCFYRGGKVDLLTDNHEIGGARTIVNLRRGADPDLREVQNRHFPISNDYEKYHTDEKAVARWLTEVVRFIALGEYEMPVLLHCTSGKDRTGVVVAALLKILNIQDDIIVEEYLLSDGEVREEWIRGSLAGIGDTAEYFKRIKGIQNIHARFGVETDSSNARRRNA